MGIEIENTAGFEKVLKKIVMTDGDGQTFFKKGIDIARLSNGDWRISTSLLFSPTLGRLPSGTFPEDNKRFINAFLKVVQAELHINKGMVTLLWEFDSGNYKELEKTLDNLFPPDHVGSLRYHSLSKKWTLITPDYDLVTNQTRTYKSQTLAGVLQKGLDSLKEEKEIGVL